MSNTTKSRAVKQTRKVGPTLSGPLKFKTIATEKVKFKTSGRTSASEPFYREVFEAAVAAKGETVSITPPKDLTVEHLYHRLSTRRKRFDAGKGQRFAIKMIVDGNNQPTGVGIHTAPLNGSSKPKATKKPAPKAKAPPKKPPAKPKAAAPVEAPAEPEPTEEPVPQAGEPAAQTD